MCIHIITQSRSQGIFPTKPEKGPSLQHMQFFKKRPWGKRCFSMIYLMSAKMDQKDHPCQHPEYQRENVLRRG